MARRKQDIILENVVIEAVAAEGKALARIDGTVLFVQFAVPGDIVDVKVTKKKKNYMEGFILRMVKPSEHRLEPFCKHFGVCGGCKWQPLPYSIGDSWDDTDRRGICRSSRYIHGFSGSLSNGSCADKSMQKATYETWRIFAYE